MPWWSIALSIIAAMLDIASFTSGPLGILTGISARLVDGVKWLALGQPCLDTSCRTFIGVIVAWLVGLWQNGLVKLVSKLPKLWGMLQELISQQQKEIERKRKKQIEERKRKEQIEERKRKEQIQATKKQTGLDYFIGVGLKIAVFAAVVYGVVKILEIAQKQGRRINRQQLKTRVMSEAKTIVVRMASEMVFSALVSFIDQIVQDKIDQSIKQQQKSLNFYQQPISSRSCYYSSNRDMYPSQNGYYRNGIRNIFDEQQNEEQFDGQ